MYSASSVGRRQFQYNFYTFRTETSVAVSAVCIPELCVQVSTAVWYAAKFGVTSHDTSTSLLETFQASDTGELYAENFSEIALSF